MIQKRQEGAARDGKGDGALRATNSCKEMLNGICDSSPNRFHKDVGEKTQDNIHQSGGPSLVGFEFIPLGVVFTLTNHSGGTMFTTIGSITAFVLTFVL